MLNSFILQAPNTGLLLNQLNNNILPNLGINSTNLPNNPQNGKLVIVRFSPDA